MSASSMMSFAKSSFAKSSFVVSMLAVLASGCGSGGGGGGGAATTSAALTQQQQTPGVPSELLLARSAPPSSSNATWTSDASAPVTALARIPGGPALAATGGTIVTLDGSEAAVVLGGRIGSIAVASSKVYAASASTSGGTATVHLLDGGAWQASLFTSKRSCVVASLGASAFAIAGDASGSRVSRHETSGAWADLADLGGFEPLCAVELRGELWIGGRTPAGTARLLRGDGSRFVDLSLPVALLAGETSSAVALAVVSDHLWVSVAVRDEATGAARQGAILGVTHAGQAVLVDQLPSDVALALAGWDGALWVGTERGELHLLDETGSLELDASYPEGGSPIRVLAGGDSLLAGSDAAIAEHEWTPLPFLASVYAVMARTTSPAPAPTGASPSAAATTAAATMTFSSIAPKLGPTTGGTTVKITGTNFASITSVKLGGVALTNLSVTATTIQGKTGAHAAGKVDLVVSSSTNGTLTKAGAFTYYVPMTIASIAPVSGPVAGGTALTIKGTNFLNVTSVTAGGVALTNLVVTATQITGKTGAHAPGKVSVVVKSATNGTVTKANGFTYGVTIKAISPASGPPAGGTAVTITGTNFLNVTSVKVGGVELSARVVTATKITGKTGAHAAGRVDVVVASSTQGTATKVGAFTYAAPALSFATHVKPILEAKCTVCHTQNGPSSFAPFTDVAGGPAIYARVRNGVSTYNTPATYVVPGDATKSLIVVKTQAGGAMSDKLTTAEAQTIKDWVLAGANP